MGVVGKDIQTNMPTWGAKVGSPPMAAKAIYQSQRDPITKEPTSEYHTPALTRARGQQNQLINHHNGVLRLMMK